MTQNPHEKNCKTYTFHPTDDDVDNRLDAVVTRHISHISRSQAAQLIDNGNVLVDDAPIKRATRITGDESITVHIPAEDDTPLKPVNLHLNALYEDTHIAVINKPAELIVHPAEMTHKPTLVHGILHKYDSLPALDSEEKSGIVHRLDKNTTGCLVIARTEEAQEGMQALFAQRKVYKEYRTIVQGMPPQDEFTIEEAIGRNPKNRKKMTILPIDRGGRRAVSHVSVIERFGTCAAYLAVRIETGRTHQIRVHLSHLHLPVLGDDTYGKRTAKFSLSLHIQRQMLHAYKISFPHPCTQKNITVTSPLPEDMSVVLDILREQYSPVNPDI